MFGGAMTGSVATSRKAGKHVLLLTAFVPFGADPALAQQDAWGIFQVTGRVTVTGADDGASGAGGAGDVLEATAELAPATAADPEPPRPVAFKSPAGSGEQLSAMVSNR